MKYKTLNLLLAIGSVALGASQLKAQVVLQNEHVDVGINYEDGMWDLHIHDETHDVEYAPDEAILQVNATALTTVSANPLFSFLGFAGSPVWILPNTESPGLLFLGIGAEELANGLFVNDAVSLRLLGVSGPGEFALFDFTSLGDPLVVMNSRDGFSAADAFTATAGGHNHLNWAFSAPGVYSIHFEASGTLADGNVFTSSGPVAYTFEVVPEPSTWALVGLGGLGPLLHAARRRRTAGRASRPAQR